MIGIHGVAVHGIAVHPFLVDSEPSPVPVPLIDMRFVVLLNKLGFGLGDTT